MSLIVEYPKHLRHCSGMSASEQVSSAVYLKDLMRAIAAEDNRQAFIQLFNLMAPKVKAFMRQGGAPDSMAEDLTQEVMLKIWLHRLRYDADKAAVSTWVYTIARNVRIDLFRKIGRQEIDEHDPALRPAEAQDPDIAIDQSDQADRLKQHLAELPEEQREVLQLSYFAGLSHQEIAAKTNTPYGTVKSRIRLATNRLRGDLKEFV